MIKVASIVIALSIIIVAPFAMSSARFVDVIIVLDSAYAPGTHATNKAHASQVARSMGLSVYRTYGTALFGFSAKIPEGRLQGLQHDPRIAYVDLDRQVSLPIPRSSAPRRCTDNSDGPGCNKDDGSSDDPSTGQATPWGIERISANLNNNEGNGIQ